MLLTDVKGLAFSNRMHLPTNTFARTKRVGGLRLSADDTTTDGDATVCLVTGASQGIGKCIALELAKTPNVKLVINHIEGMEDDANNVVKEIEELGREAIAVKADCSKQEDIKEMFSTIKETYGKCDVLVNNAGIARDSLMIRMKPEQWAAVINLNLSGVYFVSQEFFKMAVKNKCGRVVNIASVVGQIGNPGQANYAAAKAGVIGLTKSNAKEFARRNIKVNAVCPGFIESAMTAALGEEYLEDINKQVPLGRLGKPQEVAGMVRFLALDPASEYITGHTFNVDGGIAIGV